jgi:hypothetical protein
VVSGGGRSGRMSTGCRCGVHHHQTSMVHCCCCTMGVRGGMMWSWSWLSVQQGWMCKGSLTRVMVVHGCSCRKFSTRCPSEEKHVYLLFIPATKGDW